MRIDIVSPHDDDAVFSLCEHMLTWLEDGHDVTVITVFGGMPGDDAGNAKHDLLASEHYAVMNRMGADAMRFHYLDDVYQPRPRTAELVDSLNWALDGADVVIGPTGIHHPDHIQTADAMRDVKAKIRYHYNEIPYYVQYPMMVNGGVHAPLPFREHLESKGVFCEMYESQVSNELRRMLYVPERLWM